MDYDNIRKHGFGCKLPEFHYNMYLLTKRNAMMAGPVSVYRQMGYGLMEKKLNKGKYTLLVINWRNRQAKSDFTLSTYGTESDVKLKKLFI